MKAYPPCCEENVHKVNGTLCPESYCRQLGERIDQYCMYSGLPPCAPVPQLYEGNVCYCCCSAFSTNASVEVQPGTFQSMEQLVPGKDRVLAGRLDGGKVVWEEREVDFCSGIDSTALKQPEAFSNLYYLVFQIQDNEAEEQSLLVTKNHLLMLENGKLKPVQFLKPGDSLMSAHGGTALVQFVALVQYKGALFQLSFDHFDRCHLDRYLINTNGVVSADFSVQLAYSSQLLDSELLDQPEYPRGEEVGTPQYQARHENEHLAAFLKDASRWPHGVTPQR